MSDGSAPYRTGSSVPTSWASANDVPSYHWPFGEPAAAPVGRPRPSSRGVIAGAAPVALLVGSGAGFGAARLAGSGADAQSDPGTSTDPAPLPSGETTSTVEVARRVLPSTVMIEVGSGSGTGTGSGFVLDRQGHVMTNNHVVAGAVDGSRIRVVFSDGRQTTATRVGRSPSYDLAVIKVKADVPLRRPHGGLRAGDRVSTVDGRTVETREELVVVIRTHRPGDKVTFGYTRGSDEGEAELTLGGRVG
ncbi:MAG: trypsin-like peptidase domain-containing protein [Janthinobacterium lividum]